MSQYYKIVTKPIYFQINAERTVDAIFYDVKKILDPIVANLHPDIMTH